MLSLYNTTTKSKKDFVPLDQAHVKMYVCGPTVYSTPHIGNARPAVVFDLLSRLLRGLYPKLTYVRNITDVDDKIQQAATQEGTSIDVITQRYTACYHHDMQALGCLPPDIEPRATENIATMIELIAKLIERNHAYVSESQVLFSVASYAEHGVLSGRDKAKNRAGARIAVADYKKDPEDFILWKPSTEQEPGWDSPWGRGRPGWHIECTAMIIKHLGMPIDIHGGGGDLLFPHHENEQAQGCCLGKGKVYSRYWVHNGMIALEKEKMSKSLGNIILVKDLLKNFPGEVVRLVLLQTHYRQPITWKEELLVDAKNCLDKYYRIQHEYNAHFTQITSTDWQDVPQPIQQALLDDMNTPAAIRLWQDLFKSLPKTQDIAQQQSIARAIIATNHFFGLGYNDPQQWFHQDKATLSPEQIDALIAKRNHARAEKDFATADTIRKQLNDNNITIEDSKGKTTWRYH